MAQDTYPLKVKGSEIIGHRVRPETEYKVILYDFKRPDKFSKEQIRTVHVIHEAIGRTFAPTLSGIVGRPLEITCGGVDQMTFVEFLESVPEISAYAPITMSPLRGSMLMQMDGSLAQFLVRSACGSVVTPGSEFEPPSRALTEIEQIVLKDSVERFLPALNECWRRVVPLSTGIVDVGTNPQTMQIVPPTEMIILGSLVVQIGEAKAHINFAIPYITIEPIVGKLSAMWWYSSVRRGSTPAVASRVVGLPVSVEVFADTAPIRLSELQSVADGAAVELPSLSDGTVKLAAGGVPIAELRTSPDRFAEDEPLELSVTSYRTGPISRRLTQTSQNGEPSALESRLAGSIENLSGKISDIKRTVDEMRDDRESLMAELTDSQERTFDQSREPELDRRYHHDIAVALASEDPSTIAFVLAPVNPETAAAVLTDIDETKQADVVRAIVLLGDADRDLHRKLLAFIGRRITRSLETTTSGGPDVVAEILNNTPRSLEKRVMTGYQEDDPELFEEIAKRMFVFEDMVLLDQKAIVKVAACVEPEELALALKGTPAEVKSHILQSIDDDTKNAVMAKLETIGPVVRRDVEAAQRDIIEELRILEHKGEIKIARPDEMIE